MDREEALRRLHYITRGIDMDQCESDVDSSGKKFEGWWETSIGVTFGNVVLSDLEDLICALTEA